MKKVVALSHAGRVLAGGPLLVVATRGEDRDNISTVAWSTPVDYDPARVAIVVDKTHRTWENLERHGFCTLNVVGLPLLRAAVFAGTVSGRDIDKIAATGLLTVAGSAQDVPILPQFMANLECRVYSLEALTGLVVLDVLACFADEEAFYQGWKMENGIIPVQHLGDDRFAVGGEIVRQAPLKVWTPA